MADLYLYRKMIGNTFKFPRCVEIDGCEYPINTDFRIWMQVESLLTDQSTELPRRLAKILTLVYHRLPPDPKKALDRVLWFRSGGKTPVDCQEETGNGEMAYNLEWDFGYIRAAFLGQYDIDLMYSYMHWWQFCTFLECLDPNCFFCRMVGYRCADLSAIKDPEMRKFYVKMKKRYRLPPFVAGTDFEKNTVDAIEVAFL